MPLKGENALRPTYVLGPGMPAGPSSTVRRSYHDVFQKPCVQKTVDLNGLADALYRNEPQLAQDLDHPHVVAIWEAQYDPGVAGAVTFVMPDYQGGSVVEAIMAGHRFSVIEAIDLGLHLADALAYVHEVQCFLHRDVKPGNLLLDGSRTWGYLSDFGSAARFDPSGHTRPAGFTEIYLDPEAMKVGWMDRSSDIYSAGLVLFESLCGPFDYRSYDGRKGVPRLAAGKRPFPARWLTWEPHVPDRLRRVVSRAVRVDRSGRFQTAADYASALQRVRSTVIDWRRVAGAGNTGEWIGTWPPGAQASRQRTYRVTSRPLLAGSSKGLLRLEASYRTATTTAWRGFGVQNDTADPQDARAVSRFFSNVLESVAHNRAAR